MHCDFPDSSDEKSFDGTTSPLICSDDVMQSAMKPNYHMDRPQMSYTALISNAIRDSCCGKLLLCDIYKHIMCNHAYYRYADPGWKVSRFLFRNFLFRFRNIKQFKFNFVHIKGKSIDFFLISSLILTQFAI